MLPKKLKLAFSFQAGNELRTASYALTALRHVMTPALIMSFFNSENGATGIHDAFSLVVVFLSTTKLAHSTDSYNNSSGQYSESKITLKDLLQYFVPNLTSFKIICYY
jgi:hypothetical protein